MTTSKLPTETRPIRLDPDLAAAVEKILRPLRGAKLDRARTAIERVARSGFTGQFSDLVAHYREAIEEAVAE